MQAPATCLHSLPILDPEVSHLSEATKSHSCPNKLIRWSSPDADIYRETINVSLKLKWQQIYIDSIQATRSFMLGSESISLDTSPLGIFACPSRKLLYKALSSVYPPHKLLSFNEICITSLPYFSQIINKASSQRHSRKLLTSKIFPHTSPSQLDILSRYGGFGCPNIIVPATPTAQSYDSDSYDSSSSQDFYPSILYSGVKKH